jgi:hypothetical protein
MTPAPDMRIPILFGAEPGPDDAALVEDGFAMPTTGYAIHFAPGLPGHAFGCACCTQRGPAAGALARLYRDRATGAAPFFKRITVLASPEGNAAVRTAVETDVVAQARYRLDA